MNLATMWHFLLGAGELIHVFVSMLVRGTTIIMLYILGATTQNVVTWTTRHPEVVHPWLKIYIYLLHAETKYQHSGSK